MSISSVMFSGSELHLDIGRLPDSEKAMIKNTVSNKFASMPKLALLREEFFARSMREDFRSQWWRALGLEKRRTFCALAGLDDSVEFSNRTWERVSLESQLLIAKAARDWARDLEPMRLA